MIKDIFMPALSSTMTEGKIVSWVKFPGDKVKKGETIVVVESDKADMDVESFYDGYLANILVQAGEEAPVGSPIAFIAETEAEIEEAQKLTNQAKNTRETTVKSENLATSETVDKKVPSAVKQISSTNGRSIASPRARKLAKQLGVNLASLQGSGPHGRIIASDVERSAGKTSEIPSVLESKIQHSPTTTTTLTASPSPEIVPTTPVNVPVGETVPLNTLQQAVVRNMVASLEVPTFHISYDITTDALDQLYQQIKPKGVTMSALLTKAVALTLSKHPIVNSSYTNAGIQYHSNVNVAVAVAMPDGGLITPVLKNADQLDIYSLARNWKDLVNRARLKQLQPDEYNSGTFTISNLGMFGVSTFDAILPPNQGGILAIGAAKPQIVATGDGLFGVKNQMRVNITCDHRVIYGANAAAFLQDLAKLIETETHLLTM
jgi:pyruvate dehydrogenase E2 component (dihydrolipoamide acetyltransferase)